MTAGQALPELASVPWRARTDARWLRRWGRIWHAWTLLYTVPFIAAARGHALARPDHRPGGAGGRGARVDHPRAVRRPRRHRRDAPRARAARGPSRSPQGLLGDLLGHQRARAAARDRPGARARRARRVAGRRGRRAADHARRPAACTASASRATDASCRRPTAWRTCCSRCASTRRASPPWPTTPSRARPGGCAGACRERMRPAIDEARCAARRRRPVALASAAVAYDVVIAGGGFGGLYAARRLERRLPRAQRAHPAGQRRQLPALHAAAARAPRPGSLEPRHVVVPLREELEWTDLQLGRVTGADPDRRRDPRRDRRRPRARRSTTTS